MTRPLPAYTVPKADRDLLLCGVNYGTTPAPADLGVIFKTRRAHALAMTKRWGHLGWMSPWWREAAERQREEAE